MYTFCAAAVQVCTCSSVCLSREHTDLPLACPLAALKTSHASIMWPCEFVTATRNGVIVVKVDESQWAAVESADGRLGGVAELQTLIVRYAQCVPLLLTDSTE